MGSEGKGNEKIGVEYLKELVDKIIDVDSEGFKQYKENKSKKNSKETGDLIDPESITLTVKRTDKVRA
ncbi:MAG: hypothetical protein ACE5GV_10900 [Candidatus Scalindua sp.]